MAIFHIDFKILKRSEGKSSLYLAAYNARMRLKDEKTGKNVDRYGKECYPKSKLRTAKKRVCNKKHRCFCKKLLFFEILVRPLDK